MSGFVVLSGGGSALTPPANPADDGKLAVASAGDLTYLGGSAVGQVPRWTAGGVAFGALDLADTDAVTGALPVANLGGFGAAGSVLLSTGAAWAAGAVDLADTDAVTGRLPVDNLALGAARSVLTSNAVANSWSATPNVDGIYVGVTLPTVGAVRFAHGTAVTSRNSINTADRGLIDFGSTVADQWTVGDGNAAGQIRTNSTGIGLLTAGANRVTIQGTTITVSAGVNINFASTHAAPTINQNNVTGVGATASDLTIQAQNATGGGASIGGDLILTGGSGATNGLVYLQTAGVSRLSLSDTAVESLVSIFRFDEAIGNCSISIQESSAGPTNQLTVSGQNSGAGNNDGGRLVLVGGTAAGTGKGRGVAIGTESINTTLVEVTEVTSSQPIVSLCRGAVITATEMPANTGAQVIYVGDATTPPTANSVDGHIYYGTGGVPAWRTEAGNIVVLSAVSAATASAGGGAAVPLTVSEFLTLTYNGNTRKIALFAA